MDLYPYQLQAVNIMKQRSYALFFPMGTGKTATAITAAKEFVAKGKPVLIVCSKAALQNWKEEILIWDENTTPDDICILGHKYSGKKKAEISTKREFKWYITNHHTLQNKEFSQYWIEIAPPAVFIADEAQRFTNIEAKWTEKFILLSMKTRNNGGKVYILTGTPSKNGEWELWSLIRAVNTRGVDNFDYNYQTFLANFFADVTPPKAQGKFKIFVVRYAMREEFDRIVAENSISISKTQALPFLPPLIKKVSYVPMTKDQIKVYKDLENKMRAEYKGKEIKAFEARSLLMRFRQIASGVVPITEQIFTNMPKTEALLEIIENKKAEEGDGKTIIWANFNPAVDFLLDLLKKYGVATIRGGQTEKERQNEIDMFRNTDSIRIMVANPQAGGDSINLVEADLIIRWDQSYSFERTDQSDARCWRKGSERFSSILRNDLICEGSVEEQIHAAVGRKQSANAAIIEIAQRMVD